MIVSLLLGAWDSDSVNADAIITERAAEAIL